MKHPDLRHIDHFIQREARNLKPTAVIVWAFLFTRANPKLIVSPWVDLISLKTNCSKNRVKIALAQLERDGYLE
ncbi:MAG: helix-turn-helix domain-containing protein, partial [Isosphaeraceae bacterium]